MVCKKTIMDILARVATMFIAVIMPFLNLDRTEVLASPSIKIIFTITTREPAKTKSRKP